MFIRNFLILILAAVSCAPPSGGPDKAKRLKVVTTTSLLAEMAGKIGGTAVDVEGLMGAGVDPHLYKASEGDVNLLFNADIVFYNGLHLEGKMQDILEKMNKQGKHVIPLSDTLSRDSLIASANFASNYDPHIWFDIANWKIIAACMAGKLSEADTANRDLFEANALQYIAGLDSTEQWIKERIREIPAGQRVLITAHDAFNYFGRAYHFEVMGLQGISTAAEAGVQDVQKLAQLIVDRKIKAIFIESSVPVRNIEALREAVQNKGFKVEIGGSLFSDALGNPGTPEGTYRGMFMHNVNTIVNALK